MTTTTSKHTRRCLYCPRFVKAGVTRCARCDARALALRPALPAVTTGCSAAEWATFVAPTAAVGTARRAAWLGFLVAIFAALACR